eukprot:s2453_g9.t1
MLLKVGCSIRDPHSWCVADDLLHTTTMSVAKASQRSKWVKTCIGVVEGRKLSPIHFCLGQQFHEEVAGQHLVGVGLNPPLDAVVDVVAYHKDKDGSDDGKYDVDSARLIFDAVSSGSCGWDSAMQQASSDTTQFILLDLASNLRKSMRSFVDDSGVPVCSHGHAAAAIQFRDTVAAEEQYMYKAGKCKIVANGFVHKKPISLQGSLAQCSDNAVQLGCCVDSKYDASAQLSLILTQGRQKMAQLQSDMLNLGLPVQALVAALLSRVQPGSDLWHGTGCALTWP